MTAPLRAGRPLYETIRGLLDPGVKAVGVAAEARLAAARAVMKLNNSIVVIVENIPDQKVV